MDVQDNEDRTPLLLAAHSSHQSIMKTLIHLGCDISKVDALGMNAIHYAATNGYLDALIVSLYFYRYYRSKYRAF